MYTAQKNNKKLKVRALSVGCHKTLVILSLGSERFTVYVCGLFKGCFIMASLHYFQALYEQSLHIKSAIPHPLIMGVIRGKKEFT